MDSASSSSELDLGILPKKDKGMESCCPSPCDSDAMDKPRYPSLEFRGDHADLFRKKYGGCAPGDEYSMEIKLRVKLSSDGTSDYDKRIEFDVLSIIGDVVEEESTEAADDEGAEPKPAAKPRKLGKT